MHSQVLKDNKRWQHSGVRINGCKNCCYDPQLMFNELTGNLFSTLIKGTCLMGQRHNVTTLCWSWLRHWWVVLGKEGHGEAPITVAMKMEQNAGRTKPESASMNGLHHESSCAEEWYPGRKRHGQRGMHASLLPSQCASHTYALSSHRNDSNRGRDWAEL